MELVLSLLQITTNRREPMKELSDTIAIITTTTRKEIEYHTFDHETYLDILKAIDRCREMLLESKVSAAVSVVAILIWLVSALFHENGAVGMFWGFLAWAAVFHMFMPVF